MVLRKYLRPAAFASVLVAAQMMTGCSTQPRDSSDPSETSSEAALSETETEETYSLFPEETETEELQTETEAPMDLTDPEHAENIDRFLRQTMALFGEDFRYPQRTNRLREEMSGETEDLTEELIEEETEEATEALSEELTGDVSEDTSEEVSGETSEEASGETSETQPETATGALSEELIEDTSEGQPEAVTEALSEELIEDTSEGQPEAVTEALSEDSTEALSEDFTEDTAEGIPEALTEDTSEEQSEAAARDTSEVLTEALPEEDTEDTSEEQPEEAAEALSGDSTGDTSEDIPEALTEDTSEEQSGEAAEASSEALTEAATEGMTEEATEGRPGNPNGVPLRHPVSPADHIIPLEDHYRITGWSLPRPQRSLNMLENVLTRQIAGYEGTWSVYLRDLSGESAVSSIGVNVMPVKSASVMKLFIMGAVYDAIDHHTLARTDEVISRLSGMIRSSSNTDANRLLEILGGGSIREGIREVNSYIVRSKASGYTRLYNGFDNNDYLFDPDHNNTVYPPDCADLLEKIYHRTFSSRKVCNEIETLMIEQETRYKIPKGVANVSDGVTIGNKTGEMDGVENDVAIVYSPACDYILCVFSSGWPDKDTALTQIQSISEQVYRYYNDSRWLSKTVHLLPEKTGSKGDR